MRLALLAEEVAFQSGFGLAYKLDITAFRVHEEISCITRSDEEVHDSG
jgi:hypothetical protein